MKIVKTAKMQGLHTQNSLFSLTPMWFRRNVITISSVFLANR